MFDTLEMSLSVLEQLAPIESKIRQRRKSLADEIGRTAESVAFNVSEARQRAGLAAAESCSGMDLARVSGGSIGWTLAAQRVQQSRPSMPGSCAMRFSM